MSQYERFISRNGLKYQIERDSQIIVVCVGLPNHEKSTSKAYIGFLPGSDIRAGDWLINPVGERYYVCDTKTSFFNKEPNQLMCYYLTENEYDHKSDNASPIFNIGTANGSVIGTQANVVLNYNDALQQVKNQVEACTSVDREDLQQIIQLLEMIVNNQVPVQKGLLSKFSGVMERNSWITGAVSSTLLGWLMSQVL